MRTDTLFHLIFTYQPNALFELLQQPDLSQKYKPYTSVEVKEKAFRMDGVLFPLITTFPLLFVEVQMQLDRDLFRCVFAEVSLFVHQQNYAKAWKVLLIFKDPSVEPPLDPIHQTLKTQGILEIRYLNDLLHTQKDTDSIAIDTLRLIVTPEQDMIPLARKVFQQSQLLPATEQEQKFGEIIETIILGKFSNLTREEVQVMLNLDFDVKQTRIYQEAIEEGHAKALEEERQKIGRHVVEALTAKFGSLSDGWHKTIQDAPTDKILDLYGKAMAAQRLEDVAL